MVNKPPEISLKGLRSMFYMVTPNETSYEHLHEVPNFVDGAVPYFTMMIVVECVLLKVQGKNLPRINDGVNSMSHGLLSTLHSLLFRSVELVIYTWLYNRFCLITLPWDSPITWIIAFVSVDFYYYWFHRWSHESNIIWASHQVHHSSEEYNLTTALRQSLMQKYYSMVVNWPMALFVPPSAYYVHVQFNLLYQFWIHTEVITTIGPLEYILNTPSHHRVHHGRNPYCIDKNYAGTLIIWDRMFNTFQAEGEKVVYGLVHPNQFWNPVWGQFYHYFYILGLVKEHKGLTNKVSAVVKGPGWEPGKPWTGLFEDLPEVEQPVKKYNSCLPTWASVYVLFHFTATITSYSLLAPHKSELTALTGLACVLYFVYSVTVYGALFDHWRFSSLMETVRCALVLAALRYFLGPITVEMTFITAVYAFYFLSAILWAGLTLTQYQLNVVRKKVE